MLLITPARRPIIRPAHDLWSARRRRLALLNANGKFILGDTGKFQHTGTAGKFDVCEECCGCRASVTLTVTGVDGNPCNCFVDGANYYDYYNLGGVDGAYSVPLTNSFLSGGKLLCNYNLSPALQNLGGTIDRDVFNLADTTCATPIQTDACTLTAINVQVWHDTQRLRVVQFFIWKSPGVAPGVEVLRHTATNYPGGTAIGGSFANALACGAFAGSSSGSGVVS